LFASNAIISLKRDSDPKLMGRVVFEKAINLMTLLKSSVLKSICVDDLGKSFVCPVDIALLWRSFDVAAMEDSGCSVVWWWTMRVVFFSPFLRRALQGDPPLSTPDCA